MDDSESEGLRLPVSPVIVLSESSDDGQEETEAGHVNVINESESSDGEEIVFEDNQPPNQPTTSHPIGIASSSQSATATRPIRELIIEAKRLLMQADAISRPELVGRNPGSLYNFSHNVTGSDLFRERELIELIDIVSSLKERLSAEAVFALGCPSLAHERDIFDELLLRYSEDVLSETRDVSAQRLAVPSAQEDGVSGRSGPLQNETSSGRDIIGDVGVATAVGDASQPVEDIGNTANQSSVLPSAIEEFITGTTKLSEAKCLTAESLAQKVSDPDVIRILKSLYKSLARLTASEETPASPPSSQKKRKRSQDSDNNNAKKVKKEETISDFSEGESGEDCCSICLEPWTTGGEHGITSLKCGHLFGLSCITKWVDQDKSCPQCKSKAKRTEFRALFVKNIMAEDSSQRDRAVLLLELEKEKSRKLEQSEALLRRKLDIQKQDNELMREELVRAKARGGSDQSNSVVDLCSDPQPGSSTGSSMNSSSSSSISCHPSTSQPSSLKKFHLFQRVHISQEGQCRVFDYSADLSMTVVSQKSANPLFRGFGIKMLSRDFRPLSYQPLHSAAIRDMSFKPGSLDGMLLSCGLDKTIVLSSVTSRVVVQKYSVNTNVWCCAWNTHDTNLFYAGMERGIVREFDIRRTDAHVRDVWDNGRSPVNNLQFWRGTDSQGNFFQGLLIAQLQNLVFKQQVRNNFTGHILPQLKAPVMNLCLHPSGKFLASYRPSTSIAKCRYEVSDLRVTNEEQQQSSISSRIHAMFNGGKVQAVISRNCLLSRPESESGLLAATADHASNSVNIWDFDTRANFQNLPCFDIALDIKPLEPPNATGRFLGVLTDKDLVLYKWRQ